MRIYRFASSALALVAILCSHSAFAAMPPDMRGTPINTGTTGVRVSARTDCAPGRTDIDQDVNNVRARLQTGGDVWWDGSMGRYIVPKPPPGELEVSSIFAAAVWLGGYDNADNLKLAAQQYGRGNGSFDYWPGPLDEDSGEISSSSCSNWDKFFVVNASEVREHQRLFAASLRGEITYTADMIPEGVKGWPGRANPYFFDVHQFEPQTTDQGLAGFYEYCDDDGNCNIDNIYDPLQGDYPIIEIEGCTDFYNPIEDFRDAPQFPDQMIFWVYNDNGNVHEQSVGSEPLQMEVQVQAFAYSTNDALNNMTFQRYKLVNRGRDLLTDTYFGIWIDGDLGCSEDDYIGCDTTRSLAYYYNTDPIDGSAGATCSGVNTYGSDVPLIGIDYFRGPKEVIELPDTTIERELGMSSFTYFIRPDLAPLASMSDPRMPGEYYALLTGSWKDGTAYTAEGTGYQTNGFETKFVFPSPPRASGPDVWSMCSENLGESDRRTIQASGPFKLNPGDVNELIIGVPWIADEETYPCPLLDRLLAADDLAQNLFDACFDITDGPDAPDVDIIELDRKLTLVLTNDEEASNNAFLSYEELDLLAPDGVSDSLYRFEGYKVYQLRNESVSIAALDDPTQARLIAQSDLDNGVMELYNWNTIVNPLDPSRPVFEPEAQVEASNFDEGIQTVIRITTDQFASGQDTRLINHKPYYFTVVSYAFNSYEDFDPITVTGQPRPYLEGRNNIMTYVGVPRPITDVVLPGDNIGAQVTRLDGVGTSNFFLDLAEGERERLFENSDFMPVYQRGMAPVVARTYNPFESRNGLYRIEFMDETMGNDTLSEDGTWTMYNQDGDVVIEGQSFTFINEQVIGELGVSVTLGQVDEPGSRESPSNGCIGYELEVLEEGSNWFGAVPNRYSQLITGDDDTLSFSVVGESFNFVQNLLADQTGPTGDENDAAVFDKDPEAGLTTCFDDQWYPFGLIAFENPNAQLGLISPGYQRGATRTQDTAYLRRLNNVDIVFTDDKSLWSRCVVVETVTPDFTVVAGLESEGGAQQFDLRQAPSVSKEDADGDGMPDPDGDGMGMGWFPGYAIDVETGQRLNIFFGENSAIHYSDDPFSPYNLEYARGSDNELELTGRDMIFNPTQDIVRLGPGIRNFFLYQAIAGGHHYIYVTREPYDGCEEIRTQLEIGRPPNVRDALKNITYSTIPIPTQPLKSYADGLIPTDIVTKLRVQNEFAVAEEYDENERYGEAPTGVNQGYPAYELEFRGVEAQAVPLEKGDSILSFVNVVPNPYYGYSEYEINEFSNLIRITNLPARADVTIYTLDGKFIRQYRRAETDPGVDVNPDDLRVNNRAIRSRQIYPDLDWDMKNQEGIPVASGVYLIHVNAFELGETTVKAFIIQRAFDPAGL